MNDSRYVVKSIPLALRRLNSSYPAGVIPMADVPVKLGYATPTPRARPGVAKSLIVAAAAVAVGMVALAMPPLVGSGRIGPNVFYAPTWGLAFILVDVYVWMRLRESRRPSRVGALLTGFGTTGALVSLAIILLNWKPNLPLLVSLCTVSLAVAAIGLLMTYRATGRVGRSSPNQLSSAERPADS